MNRTWLLRLSVLLACGCGPDPKTGWPGPGPGDGGGSMDASATDGSVERTDAGQEQPSDAAQRADSGDTRDGGGEGPFDGGAGSDDASVADAGEAAGDGGEIGQDSGGGTPLDGSLADGGAGAVDASALPDSGPDAGSPDASEPESDSGTAGCVAADGGVVASEPADIVMVLDGSGSMADEICNVGANLQTFIQRAGPDVRLVTVYQMDLALSLITLQLCGTSDPIGSSPLTEDDERYLHVSAPVDSVSSLFVLLNSFSAYQGFLRPGVSTHFVAITDDDSAISASDFETQMEERLGHRFTFHAVVADGANGCVGAEVGAQYLELASATGGQQLSICTSGWGDQLATLGCAIASP